MVIGHNVPALLTHLNMKNNDKRLTQAMQRLTTGMKINSAKDDAAGLAIANKLAYQVSGLNKASENATNGISMIQTAEGALSEVHNMLQRMRELAVQSSNGTLTDEDRVNIQAEIDQLTDEISATANRTEYNKIKLLNGEASRIFASDRQTAIPLYVSADTPTGTLTYDINSVGESAWIASSLNPPMTDATKMNDTIPSSAYGSITVNGVKLTVGEGDTYASVKAKMNQVCGFANLNYNESGVVPNSHVELVSKATGSSQYINVQGDAATLALFGLSATAGNVHGKDATITIQGMTNNTDPVNCFGNGASYTADGNQVTIIGTGGQVVKLNITTTTAKNDVTLEIKDYGPIMLQIGPNYNMAVSVEIPKITSETLGLVEYRDDKKFNLLDYQTQKGSEHANEVIDGAIQTISTIRARLGAYQNRLESTVRSLDTAAENTESSRSLIQDTDIAREMTEYTSRNVMYQAGLAILGQANQRPSQIISLLQ